MTGRPGTTCCDLHILGSSGHDASGDNITRNGEGNHMESPPVGLMISDLLKMMCFPIWKSTIWESRDSMSYLFGPS